MIKNPGLEWDKEDVCGNPDWKESCESIATAISKRLFGSSSTLALFFVSCKRADHRSWTGSWRDSSGFFSGALFVGMGLQIYFWWSADRRIVVSLTETLLSRYMNSHGFSELYLDSMFKYGDDNRLPREVRVSRRMELLLKCCAYKVTVFHHINRQVYLFWTAHTFNMRIIFGIHNHNHICEVNLVSRMNKFKGKNEKFTYLF